MKRWSLVFGIIFFVSVVSFAFAQPTQQGAPGMQQKKRMTPEEMVKKDEERIKARVEKLTKRFGLTEQQQAQVKDILTKTSEEVRSVIKETGEKIKGLVAKDRESINALLTEDQKAKAKEAGPGPGQAGSQDQPLPPDEV